MSKMERFSSFARQVLHSAQEEAERFQHNHIGPEHLLLGFIHDEYNTAGTILIEMGLNQDRVRQLVQNSTDPVKKRDSTELEITRNTRKVLELAVSEARKMGHHYIDAEHLLLGVVWQRKSKAIDILKELDVSPQGVRLQVYQVLKERPVPPQPSLSQVLAEWLTNLNPFAHSADSDDT